MRRALAPDPDHERLSIVDPFGQLFRACREEPVRGPLEEQEGGAGLEQRILRKELLVARLELPEVFLFLIGETLEDPPPACVLGQPCGTRVELEPAAFGRNRNPQCVTSKQQLGGAPFDGRRPPRPARFAGAVDLQDALPWSEVTGGGDLFEERLDVGTEKLEGSIAGLADQVKVTRMTVRVLETEPPLAEVDFPRDARFLHPLEGAVHGRTTDLLILFPDEIVEVVRREVPLLAEKYVDDEIALAGALAPGGPQAVEER